MKHIHKLFLTASILLLVLICLACSNESEDCNCNAKYMLENGQTFYVPNQQIDCDTKQPTSLHSSGYFVGCVD